MFRGLRLRKLLAQLVEGDAAARVEAARGLGELGDPRAIDGLIAALQDAPATLRVAAARALERLGLPEWRGLASEAASDLRALGALRDERAVAPLCALLREGPWGTRCLAAEALGLAGSQHATAPLLEALADSDPVIHKVSACALAALGDRRALGPLLELLHESDWHRLDAVRALGMLGAPEAATDLLEAVADVKPSVRRAAAEALGRLGLPGWGEAVVGDDGDLGSLGAAAPERALVPLARALESPDIALRRSAVAGLRLLPGPEAVEALLRAAGDREGTVRADAARALEERGEGRWSEWVRGDAQDSQRLGASHEDRAVDALMAMSEHDALRQSAFRGLAVLGDERATAASVGALTATWDRLAALPPRAGKPVLDSLTRELLDAKELIESLGRSATQDAIPVLLRIMTTDRPSALPEYYASFVRSARESAASALGAIGGADVVDALVRCLRAPQAAELTAAVAGALGQTGDPRTFDALATALRHAQWTTVNAIASALVAAGGERAFEPLVAELTSWNERIRPGVVRALGKLGDGRAVKPLIAMLRGEQSLVPYAATALGELGDPRAIEPLVEALPRCPAEAARALAALGEERWLSIVVGDPDDLIRLAEAGHRGAIASLANGIQDVHPRDRRTKAVGILQRLVTANPQCLDRRTWAGLAMQVRASHRDGLLNRFDYTVPNCSDAHLDTGLGTDFPDPPAEGTDF